MALGAMGSAAAPVVPRLIKALDDKDTRGSAALALGRIGTKAHAAIPRLIELLDDKDGPPYQVVFALGNFGPAAKAALPKLNALLAKSPRQHYNRWI